MRQATWTWALGIFALVAAQSAPAAEPATEGAADRSVPAYATPVGLDRQAPGAKLQINAGRPVRVYVELALAEDVAMPRSLSVGFPATHKAPHVWAATKIDPSKPFSERVQVEVSQPTPEGLSLATLPHCEKAGRVLARIEFALVPTEDAKPLRGMTIRLPGDRESAPAFCIARADSYPLVLSNPGDREAVVR